MYYSVFCIICVIPYACWHGNLCSYIKNVPSWNRWVKLQSYYGAVGRVRTYAGKCHVCKTRRKKIREKRIHFTACLLLSKCHHCGVNDSFGITGSVAGLHDHQWYNGNHIEMFYIVSHSRLIVDVCLFCLPYIVSLSNIFIFFQSLETSPRGDLTGCIHLTPYIVHVHSFPNKSLTVLYGWVFVNIVLVFMMPVRVWERLIRDHWAGWGLRDCVERVGLYAGHWECRLPVIGVVG